MNQNQFISLYNDKHRPRFNDRFFQKSDDDIIRDLKDMILSCQRDKFYTVKVLNFEVIDDYETVQSILIGQDTPTISIKDSDLKILKVTYYAKLGDEEDTFDVYIAVPRVIDNAYIHLNGNDYFPVFQLVDGSTYNNTTSTKAKNQSITLKTNSNAIKMHRNFYEYKAFNKDEYIRMSVFSLWLFSHKVTMFEYFLAKFGWYETVKMFHFEDIIRVTDQYHEEDETERYVFAAFNNKMKHPILLSVPIEILEEDRILQSFIGSVINAISTHNDDRNFNMERLFNKDFWVKRLGANFVSTETAMFTKGNAIIESLENSLDISTQKRLRLPEEYKKDIYAIIKWMACEFSYIRLKDNLDASTKRIRWSEYIAAMYIMSLNSKMRRLPEKANDKSGVKRIKQAFATAPMELISKIQKSNLKGFRNMVNDRDSFLQLKYTIKGPSGPGEGNNKTVADIVRAVNPSQLGIIDLNTSSATDPGVSGLLCPLNNNIYEWDSFTKDPEPHEWDKNFSDLLTAYREKKGIKSALTLANSIGLEINEDIDPEMAEDEAKNMETIISKVVPTKEFESYDDEIHIKMEDGGNITYDEE